MEFPKDLWARAAVDPKESDPDEREQMAAQAAPESLSRAERSAASEDFRSRAADVKEPSASKGQDAFPRLERLLSA